MTDGIPAPHGLGRRALLRNGLLVGVGVTVAGIASQALTGTASAATGEQSGWLWCTACMVMFYGPDQSTSHCPATQGAHFDYKNESFNYTNEYGFGSFPGEQQANWAWCRLCKGLFFAPNQSTSVCPAVPPLGNHDGTGSYNYDVFYNTSATSSFQINWRWCSKCQGMFFGPDIADSTCPKGGPHVIGPGSYNYGFAHT